MINSRWIKVEFKEKGISTHIFYHKFKKCVMICRLKKGKNTMRRYKELPKKYKDRIISEMI